MFSMFFCLYLCIMCAAYMQIGANACFIAHQFELLYLNMHVVHIASLHIKHDSHYAAISTPRVVPQHTLGQPIL